MVIKVKNNLPAIFLVFISILICFTNYTPSTILSGWDTLHPEFNFGLAIKREIFGVFRTYQGLGAVAAHSDMADLPRIITLAIFNLFLPMDFLRYSYIFLNIILGPIGMYFFLKRVVFSKTPKENAIPSFLGALFYLLNLGTMQQFIVPFEMFTTQYAALPWIFLFATGYLNTKTHQKKTLVLFAITTLFSAPMAYAATLWYVNFIAFMLYLGTLIMLCDKHLKFFLLKKALVLILLTLLINSFWMLPNIYFLFTHASEVAQANINKLFSPQAFLYNKQFGNIVDISLLKSFLFEWNVYSGSNHFTQLLHPWIAHLKQPIVQILGFLFAGIAFCGIVFGILKKHKILLSFLPLLLLCLFFLFNDNLPTSHLYALLADKLPFFKEVFRFPHSKIYGIFTFVFAIYFAFGQLFITSNVKKIQFAQAIIFSILLIFFMLPAFKGNFISPYMRIKIPEYYFEMFKYFDEQPEAARIANLPIHSLWGWEYYDWNQNSTPSFQGAGFVWFGIKQPFLARDFDRWSPYNEQYYNEMSYAIYSQNPEGLKRVIEKYNIKYVLLDKTIIDPQNDPKVLLHKETQKLLEEQPYINKEREFGEKIIVYKVNSNTPDNQYIAPINRNEVVIYRESIIPADVVVKKEKNQQLSIHFNPLNSSESSITRLIPPSIKEDFILSVNKKDNFVLSKIDTSLLLGTVYLNKDEKNSFAIYPKKPSQKILPDFTNLSYSLEACDNPNTKGFFGTNKTKEQNSISLLAKNKELCLTIPLKELLKDKKIGSDTLLGLELDYETNMPIVGFCLSRFIKGDCTDYGLRNQSNLGKVLEYFLLENPIEDKGLRFYQNTGSNNVENVLYKNIYLTLNSPIFIATFSADIDSTNTKAKQNIPLPSLAVGEINYNTTKKSQASTDCNNTRLVNPFLLKKQTLDKSSTFFHDTNPPNNSQGFEKVLDKTQVHFIQYSSLDETICDVFSYGDLSQNQAFQILITSKNVNGLPMSVCVKNHVTKHCDIYANLSSSSDFVTDTFLLPPMIKNETGYDIIINNLGIGKTQSINNLKSIQVIPIPYKGLNQIKTATMKQFNNEAINVLILPQSFENGWKAFRVESSKFKVESWLKTFLPFVFGKEIKNHVLVNNWSNGWILENSQLSTLNTQLIIVFLPQYLEFLGFAFLGITFLWLAYSIIKDRRTSL